jgi:hypothetical protein
VGEAQLKDRMMKSVLPFWFRLIVGVGLSIACVIGLIASLVHGQAFYLMGLGLLIAVQMVESALQELRIDELEKRLASGPPEIANEEGGSSLPRESE